MHAYDIPNLAPIELQENAAHHPVGGVCCMLFAEAPVSSD